jgi:hypothetical protein
MRSQIKSDQLMHTDTSMRFSDAAACTNGRRTALRGGGEL